MSPNEKSLLGYMGGLLAFALLLLFIIVRIDDAPAERLTPAQPVTEDEVVEEKEKKKKKKKKPSCYDKPDKSNCDISEVRDSFVKVLKPDPVNFCRYPLNYITLVNGGISKQQQRLGEWAMYNCPAIKEGQNVEQIKSWMAIGGYQFYSK